MVKALNVEHSCIFTVYQQPTKSEFALHTNWERKLDKKRRKVWCIEFEESSVRFFYCKGFSGVLKVKVSQKKGSRKNSKKLSHTCHFGPCRKGSTTHRCCLYRHAVQAAGDVGEFVGEEIRIIAIDL